MKVRHGQFCLQVRGTGVPPATELRSGIHFRLDEAAVSESLCLPLRPLEVDLLNLAIGLYAVDRLFRKTNRGNDRPAARDLEIRIQVGDPHFWESYSALISQILSFLSDDTWAITFDAGSVPLSLSSSLFRPPPETSRICLYSGGLDSCAGLVNRQAEKTMRTFAVTVYHQPQQSKRVRRHIRAMNRQFGHAITSIVSHAALVSPPRMDRQELTQRCRSFLFCSLAGAVASHLGADDIEIYEHGVGVLNLPPMTGMLWGGRATRSVHPYFLRMMGRLVSAVAGRRINFSLPFKWWTKAEMVRRLPALGLGELIADSVSCIHYPLRREGPKQCGLCAGCLGSIQAIMAAGLAPPKGTYRDDIFDPQLKSATPDALEFLRAQLLQIADLHQLTPDGASPAILHRHLSSSRAVSTSESAERWAELLTRYRNEWMGLVELGRQRGCHWASWMDGCGMCDPEIGATHE